MSRLSILALACLALFAPAAHASARKPEPRPTRAALQKALEQHERSVVRVKGPRRSGPGVIVGRDGQVLTSVEHVSLDEDVKVQHGDATLPVKVVAANGILKFAVVAAPSGPAYPATAVRLQPEGFAPGAWYIGVVRGRNKQPTPKASQARKAPAPFFDVDLALSPGSPLFDAQGRLVAMVVQRRGAGARALPLGAVKSHLGAAASTP